MSESENWIDEFFAAFEEGLKETFGPKPVTTEQMRSKVSVVPRRFLLNRNKDASGVSGTGYVASGIQWQDGKCAIRWNTETASTGIYDSIADLIAVHGHGDMTKIEWIDPK